MSKSKQIKQNFLDPINKYHGQFVPGNLVFNANLQQFAQRVSYLSGLEANGKITSEEAYNQIHKSWKQLKHSKMKLLDRAKFTPEK